MNKRDFGSFHSSNVQELLAIDDENYVPPNCPFPTENFGLYKLSRVEFGNSFKKKHFYIEDKCTFLNHGAFGGVLQQALETAQKWQLYIETQPLRFYDRELLPHLVYVVRRLAKFVGCDRNDLVLVQNVTTAINCVVKNQRLTQSDRVYCLNVRYGAVYKLLRYECDLSGATLQEEQIPLPLADKQQILDVVSSTLVENTKLAVFDHVPSNSAFIMPVEEIIQICHSRNVPVLIDGAHALGAIDLDLESLGADYYVSNAHKWFCCPKGSAFMYVNKNLQKKTRSLIVSHGFNSGFSSEFIWTGLKDYSSFLALHTVLDFWTNVSPEKIRGYMYRLIKQAGEFLVKAWDSRLLVPESMCGTMACVQLPQVLVSEYEEVTYQHAEKIQNILFHEYSIEVPVKCISGSLYVRISAHIYNELSDYAKLAKAVLDICKK